MPHKRSKLSSEKRVFKIKHDAAIRKEENLSTKNKYGFADYTPYNAITGNAIMSRATLTEMISRGYGSFNG